MDTLLECEGHYQPMHDAFCGLLRCQGVFPHKFSSENEICFTHIVEECQMIQNMNHRCDQADRNCMRRNVLYDQWSNVVNFYMYLHSCISIWFLYARLKNGTYYAVAMSVRPSVCPSVCLSVRPSAFSGLFFNMLWDINLKLGIYIQ